MFKSYLAFFLLFFTWSLDAIAGTATANFTVSATVNAACTVSANNLSFGAYDPTSATANNSSTTLNITCTNGAPYNIGLDLGTGSGATIAARIMTSGSNTLTYNLYQDAAFTTVWGPTVGTNTLASTGTGSLQTISVYGQIPASQNVQTGNYTDTIGVTVNF